MNFDDVKYRALEASVYCPPYKEDNPVETIKLENFDIEKVKDSVRSSVNLLAYEKQHRQLILEILDILDERGNFFLLDQQKYLSFFWNGIPLLRICFDKEVNHDKQLHISLSKYKSEKETMTSDKKLTVLTLGAAGISVFVGGIILGYTFLKRD